MLAPVLLSLLIFIANVSASPRIAVVGAGIGGSAASFYIQDLLKNASKSPAAITAYESRSYIGGRLKHISFGKQEAKIEVGGAAWTSSNQYVTELARRMKIPKKSTKSTTNAINSPFLNTKLGIWKGNKFAHIIDEMALHTKSVVKVLNAEQVFLNSTAANYLETEQAPPFTSISEFVKYGNLDQFTNHTMLNYFTDLNVNKIVIEDGLVPLNRAIYNQNDNSSAFSVFGSLTAMLNQENVPSGNSNLVNDLFTAANANVLLNTKVQSITKNQNSTLTVTTTAGKTDVYDVVLIAAPLEVTNITFRNIPKMSTGSPTIANRNFYPWFVTVVEADSINHQQFLPVKITSPLPGILLTNANGSTKNTPWVCIQPVGKHGKNGSDVKNVFMIYSDASLKPILDTVLINPNTETMYEQYWPYTFAHLTPTSDSKMLQPIVLTPGLYNLNSMESLASAMEVSSIGAHNGARLSMDYLNRKGLL